MRFQTILPGLLLFSPALLVGQTQQPASAPQTPAAPETETVTATQALPPAKSTQLSGEGFMEPAQVKDLLHRLWLAGYRITDLLTEVHPERWKMADSTRASFQESFDALRTQLAALESWRGQFDDRPDSMYLGYMTHASVDAILPRLDGVTRIISQRENSSLGAQFSQAGNQLFDAQQALQPFLVYLLRNQDELLYAAQSNMAACEHQLSQAKRSETERATPMKTVVPDFKGRRRPKTTPSSTAPPKGQSSQKK